MQRVTHASSKTRQQGFTIVELVVVILVMAILTAIVTDASTSYQSKARDSERAIDIETMTRSIERSYRTQAVAVGATYPASTVTITALATIIDSSDSTIAPGMSANSIVIASSSAVQTPTINQYIYQPLNLDGSLCTATPCVRFKLYYRLESTNAVVTQESVRQQ